MNLDVCRGGFQTRPYARDIVLSHYGEVRTSWVYVYLDLLYSAGYFLLALAGIRQREINVSRR